MTANQLDHIRRALDAVEAAQRAVKAAKINAQSPAARAKDQLDAARYHLENELRFEERWRLNAWLDQTRRELAAAA